MARLETTLTKLLNIEHPIMLAPMGSAAGGALAGAVSEAGGFGMIGGGTADTAWLEAEFARAGNAPVGVGFVTWMLAEKRELLTAALDHAPKAVMLSFGDQTPYIADIKAAGALLIAQVQTVAEAQQAIQTGADIVIAQGQEAGGHGRSGRGGLALAPAVVDAIGGAAPVVAGGGFADGRGLAAALMLGCAGVLIGTRFAASEESLWPASKKAALIDGVADATLRTDVFDILRRGEPWPDGYNGRALQNTTSARWHEDRASLSSQLETEGPRYIEADAKGDVTTGVVWAGEGVDFIDAISPAGEIVRRIADDAVRLVSGGAAFTLAE